MVCSFVSFISFYYGSLFLFSFWRVSVFDFVFCLLVKEKNNMNPKYLRLSPCTIMHYTLNPSTGEVSILLGKDGVDHSRDIVHLSMKLCYDICHAAFCVGFPRELVTSNFSHDRSVLISAPLENGLRYCVKISLL